MATGQRTALVTGASRGIGVEICRGLAARGYRVLLGARDTVRAAEVAGRLADTGASIEPLALDVSDARSIERACDYVRARFGHVDVLVNNAGILLADDSSADRVSFDCLESTLATNVRGPWRLIQRLAPAMQQRCYGRIVNLASSWGSLTYMGDPTASFGGTQAPAYRVAKAALNVVTVQFARLLSEYNVLVNSACPGWVRTDMGTDAAPLSIVEGADTPIWLATLPDGGPSGAFFRARRVVPW